MTFMAPFQLRIFYDSRKVMEFSSFNYIHLNVSLNFATSVVMTWDTSPHLLPLSTKSTSLPHSSRSPANSMFFFLAMTLPFGIH